MQKEQQVRFRADSSVPSWLDISPDTIGAVVCRYRVLREGEDASERLDVRFGEGQFAWGIPENEFEKVIRPNSA